MEKYGDWDNPEPFDVPKASEDDIINGMVETGCPFAYLIDYINGLGPLDPNFVRPEGGDDGNKEEKQEEKQADKDAKEEAQR